MKIKHLLLAALISLTTFAVTAQDTPVKIRRTAIQTVIRPDIKTYDLITKRRLTDEQLTIIRKNGSNLSLFRSINKYGEIDSLFVDAANPQYGMFKIDINKNLKAADQDFYDFVFKTTEKAELKSELLTSTYKLLFFQIFARKPFFNNSELAALNKKISELSGDKLVMPILLIGEEVEDKSIVFDKFLVVENAHLFFEKFGIGGGNGIQIIVLDKDNQVVGNFERAEEVDFNKLIK